MNTFYIHCMSSTAGDPSSGPRDKNPLTPGLPLFFRKHQWAACVHRKMLKTFYITLC